jgi:hypothetical protein
LTSASLIQVASHCHCRYRVIVTHLWYGTNYENVITQLAVNAASTIPRLCTLDALQITVSYIPLQLINTDLLSVKQQARLETDIKKLTNVLPDIEIFSNSTSHTFIANK